MAELKNNWLKFFSDADVDKIDQASRRVLSDVGIKFEDDELTAQLMDKGCTNNDGRLQIPSELVDAALAGLPAEITFGGRSGQKLHIRDGSVATHTGGSIPYLYDLETGKKKVATLADLEDMIRLMNHLDNLSMCGPLLHPGDVPPAFSEIIQSASVFRLGMKPGSGSTLSTSAQARYVVALCQAMSGAVDDLEKYPLMNMGISPESPLYYPKDIVGVMRVVISAGIPTVPLVAPILGFTAPMTISGGLTQMNASMLAYAVISREINPTTPVVYGARLLVANMRTAHSVAGVPEVGLLGACSVQLARHYGLPSDVYGYSSSSCTHDVQLGAENAINGFMPILAGANIISGFGSFGSGYMSSFEDLVIDNEICGMHLRAAQGVVVDDDRLAVDAIADAMNGKDFFLQPHTLKHLRNGELFETQVGLYGLVEEWEDQGSKTISENAREKAKSILAAHEDEPLPAEVEREFDRIINSAKQNLL